MYNEAGYSYQFVRHYEQSTKLRDGGCKVLLGQVKKKGVLVSRPDFYKKRGGRAVFFFCYLLFPFACFLHTLLPSPRDTLELLGQILIKRNVRY